MTTKIDEMNAERWGINWTYPFNGHIFNNRNHTIRGYACHTHVAVTDCAGTSRNWYKRRKNRILCTFSGYACGYGTALLTMVPLRSDHTGYGFDIGYVCAVVHLQTVTRFERESQPPHFAGSKNFKESCWHRNTFHRNDFIFYIQKNCKNYPKNVNSNVRIPYIGTDMKLKSKFSKKSLWLAK